MGKKFILVASFLFLLIGVYGCTNETKDTSQDISTDAELYTVANNMSLKIGTNFDSEAVLESSDFIGFSYKYDETSQEYLFTFRLTDEGKKKMTEATTNLAETTGDLSLWIGNELIVAPKVMEPITGYEFAINIADLNEDTVSAFVNKLEGK